MRKGYTTEYDEFIVEKRRDRHQYGASFRNRNETYFGGRENMAGKVAVLNDLAGFGRCSLTAAISVLSAMGVQPCPLPTADFECTDRV